MSALAKTSPKKVYANDGSYDSVKAQIHKQAMLYFSRTFNLGLPIEFSDVLQELNMAYVKAVATWKPDGARFNTYCYTACRNEFNNRMRRMEADRVNLGLVGVAQISPDFEDGQGEGYESIVGDGEALGPEDVVSARQEATARLRKLSPNAKRLITSFLSHENGKPGKATSLAAIAANLGIAGPTLSVVRRELEAVYGVKLTTLKTIRA